VSKEELISKLRECQDKPLDEGHAEADELLLTWIDDEKIEEAYRQVRRCFA